MNSKEIKNKFKAIAKYSLLSLGGIFSFIIILSFTETPFWMYYWLGVHNTNCKEKPSYIIILGGGGMPGEQNLIRLYTARQIAKKYTEAKIIISSPQDSKGNKKLSTQFLMQKELIMDGIDSNKILKEDVGKNTRAEALSIATLFPAALQKQVLIVTSPSHMYRALRTFKKAGFILVGGQPAFETVINHDIRFQEEKLGGKKLILIPEIGNNIQLRYQFWNHLNYQFLCYREYMAISYYWLKDWI